MRFITLAVVALTLFLPDTASAQGYYGRGWDRGWNRGYRPYYGGVGVYPYVSLGWGGYGYPGYSYSYSYPQTYYYGYSYPQTYYSYPETNYSVPRSSLYYDPSVPSNPAIGGNINANRASVDVIVSDPNADLYIQGQLMPGSGNTRNFISPDLEQGRAFNYTISVKNKVTGLKAEETRTIEVRAGSRTVVDFTKPDMQRLPVPKTIDPLLDKPS